MSPRNAKKTSRSEQAEEHSDQTPPEGEARTEEHAADPQASAAEAEEQDTRDEGGGEEENPGQRGGGQGTAEVEVLRDRHLRLAAEFDNYRKRTERERAESRTRAQAELVQRLLEPLDDLQRVTEVDPENTSVAALLEGVQLVQRKLLRALEAAGLERIDAQGEEFDPELHEALMMVPTDNPEEDNRVGDVLQRGYSFKGILLRPALVQVKRHDG